MWKRLWRAARRVAAECNETGERMWLLNHPWEEEFLHWVGQGEHRRLHGHVAPPSDGRRYSVTRGGWCRGFMADPYADVGDQLAR